MRILAIVNSDYGRRHVENIRKHAPKEWTLEVWEAARAYPQVIDYPEDYLSEALPPADLILQFAEHKGLAELLPDIAKMTGATAVVAAIDNEAVLPRGLARQLTGWLERMNVACVTPKPLCSLSETHYWLSRREKVAYDNPLIREFARYFGMPQFKIAVDPKTRVITSAEVTRDAVCGCARYVAEHLVGVSADDAEQEAGMLHHHYPCWAAMGVIADYSDTLMHISGNIMREAVAEQVKAYKQIQYIAPGWRSENSKNASGGDHSPRQEREEYQEADMPGEKEFFRRTQEMMVCYERGDYAGALAVTERLSAAFPKQAGRTDYWRICLLARLQKIEEALQVFREALNASLWWSEPTLRGDPDLEPLQGLPEYERMIAVCNERHAAAQATSKPMLVVREPATGAAKPYPLLIALHGQGSTAESDLPHWEMARPMGWLVAAMQSSQLAWPGAYAWNDRDKAQEEVVAQFESLFAQYPVDRDRVIVGGFSQGAALAIRLVLNGSLSSRGFLSITPGMIDRELLTAWADTARDHVVRGYLVAGGKDRRHEFFKQTCEMLPMHNVPCQMEDHPELGHTFPPDFEKSLERAFKFLLT